MLVDVTDDHRFASYGLLNLVVGVIVESTLSVAKFNNNQTLKKKQEDRKTALQHIRAAFEQMDEDGSGSLSVDELKRAMENPEVATRLKMIDFPLDDPERVILLKFVYEYEHRYDADILDEEVF